MKLCIHTNWDSRFNYKIIEHSLSLGNLHMENIVFCVFFLIFPSSLFYCNFYNIPRNTTPNAASPVTRASCLVLRTGNTEVGELVALGTNLRASVMLGMHSTLWGHLLGLHLHSQSWGLRWGVWSFPYFSWRLGYNSLLESCASTFFSWLPNPGYLFEVPPACIC